jgi:hypothetical protein
MFGADRSSIGRAWRAEIATNRQRSAAIGAQWGWIRWINREAKIPTSRDFREWS